MLIPSWVLKTLICNKSSVSVHGFETSPGKLLAWGFAIRATSSQVAFGHGPETSLLVAAQQAGLRPHMQGLPFRVISVCR